MKEIFKGKKNIDKKEVKMEKMIMVIVGIFIFCNSVQAKSLYRSRAGRHFYGTEYEIWADFGPVGNTEKKYGGPIMSNF